MERILRGRLSVFSCKRKKNNNRNAEFIFQVALSGILRPNDLSSLRGSPTVPIRAVALWGLLRRTQPMFSIRTKFSRVRLEVRLASASASGEKATLILLVSHFVLATDGAGWPLEREGVREHPGSCVVKCLVTLFPVTTSAYGV